MKGLTHEHFHTQFSRVQFHGAEFNRVQQCSVSVEWCDSAEFKMVLWCDPERKQLHPDVTPVVKLKAPLIAFPVPISILSAACHLIMKLSISIKNSSVQVSESYLSKNALLETGIGRMLASQ